MNEEIYFFLISIFAISTVCAGTWDSFEAGQMYAGNPSMCYSMRYNMALIKKLEYHVPNTCVTIMCHDSYTISSRVLEINKWYAGIAECETFSCNSRAELDVKKCTHGTEKGHCILLGDMRRPYPHCCAHKICE